MRRRFKDNFDWQQEERSYAKQSKLGFLRVVCTHIDQRCVFRGQQDNVKQPDESWLLNIEIGSKVVRVKCCLRTSPDLV
ncbi:hypothetical protein TNCV_1041821 [Trichonephila clavipes]|nr:hypothetical protein TNCV_1041821 [Trichonephila clavipes]